MLAMWLELYFFICRWSGLLQMYVCGPGLGARSLFPVGAVQCVGDTDGGLRISAASALSCDSKNASRC